MKVKFSISLLVIVSLACLFSVVDSVEAAGSATVSWTAPETNEGGGTLTDLAGYKVLYDTTSRWANNSAANCPIDVGTVIDVPNGSTTSYFFNNTLTAGQTYYFAVAAYNTATPNVSKCATGAAGVTQVSKVVTYSGDINVTPDRSVDSGDFTILASDYGRNICGPDNKADINRDCYVDSSDFTILAEDYGRSF